MRDGDQGREDLRSLLAAVEAAPPVAAVDVVAAELAKRLGAREVGFLIADFGGDALVRLGRTGSEPGHASGRRVRREDAAETVRLISTPYEQVLRTQRLLVLPGRDATRVLAPVTDRGDALGVLELDLPTNPDVDTTNAIGAAAHALAYVVIANRRFTDLFEWGQRSRPFSLAAEIQRRLLPTSLTCEGAQFTIAGALEPAGKVGGDTFDYALDRDTLHVSLTDAMGHEEQAALLATLLVAALRNSRRAGAGLIEQAARANTAVTEHAWADEFVTGQLLRVDLATGSAAIVNAGHPSPLLLRGGVVRPVPLATDLPFGMLPETGYRSQSLTLEPGDRLILLTDGMLERNAADLDLAALLADTRGLHPRETVQELMRAVDRAAGGALRDDATTFCLDWYGGPAEEREAEAGADPRRASPSRPAPSSPS